MAGLAIKRTDDLAQLIVVATQELAQALSDGDEKHPPGSWAEEQRGNHINHLVAHLSKLQAGERVDERGHTHISHIICRAVMYAAKQHREPI